MYQYVLFKIVFLHVKIIVTLTGFDIMSGKSIVLEMCNIENYTQKLVTNLLICVIRIC
jgi:hypothetical protein